MDHRNSPKSIPNPPMYRQPANSRRSQPVTSAYIPTQNTFLSDSSHQGYGGGMSRPVPPPKLRMQNPPFQHYGAFHPPYHAQYNQGQYINRTQYNHHLFNGIGMHPMYNSSPFHGDQFDNRFLLDAEESSREAFEGIESIVRAFSSITVMLDSTFQAFYGSFHAVLSVAEHLSRLQSHFGRIFSAMAIFKTLKWFYNKLLYSLGLRTNSPGDAWDAALSQSMGNLDSTTNVDAPSKSYWPIVVFLAVVYVGPFIMWRAVSSFTKKKESSRHWAYSDDAEYYPAIVLFDYQAEMVNEISIHAGQNIRVAPRRLQKSSEWLLAYNGQKIGYVPYNFLRFSNQVKQPAHLAQGRPPMNQPVRIHCPQPPRHGYPQTVPGGIPPRQPPYSGVPRVPNSLPQGSRFPHPRNPSSDSSSGTQRQTPFSESNSHQNSAEPDLEHSTELREPPLQSILDPEDQDEVSSDSDLEEESKESSDENR